MIKSEFLTGNEAAVRGILAAGADIMFGYPITPSTEILEGWIAEAGKNKKLQYLQTEDETAAGFAVIGSLLAGAKAFTATAGPGHTLMQDPLSMAENLRLPFVEIVMQRGGPSTGTVNYSQQEVNLAAFGGNGDGLRIVYSASTVKEMYELSAKAFSTAWKFRFPTVLLGDGYLAKMRSKVKLTPPLKPINSSLILKEGKTPTHLRNCYSSEALFGEVLKKNVTDWNEMRSRVVESDTYKTTDAKEIIIAHGLIADATRETVDILRQQKQKIGLFRPITLHPFDTEKLVHILKHVKRIYIVESSLNQLSRIVKYELANRFKNQIIEIVKPAESFSSEEIARKISSIK